MWLCLLSLHVQISHFIKIHDLEIGHSPSEIFVHLLNMIKIIILNYSKVLLLENYFKVLFLGKRAVQTLLNQHFKKEKSIISTKHSNPLPKSFTSNRPMNHPSPSRENRPQPAASRKNTPRTRHPAPGAKPKVPSNTAARAGRVNPGAAAITPAGRNDRAPPPTPGANNRSRSRRAGQNPAPPDASGSRRR